MMTLNLLEQEILAWYKILRPEVQHQVDVLVNEDRDDELLTLFSKQVGNRLDSATRVLTPEK
jgi:hypothetical protein